MLLPLLTSPYKGEGKCGSPYKGEESEGRPHKSLKSRKQCTWGSGWDSPVPHKSPGFDALLGW